MPTRARELPAETALRRLINGHKHGSSDTIKARKATAHALVETLSERGYSRDMRKPDFTIKERHLLRAIEGWREAGITDRTIANRISHIRRLCQWQGNERMIKQDHAHYLPDRDSRRLPERAPPAVAPGTIDVTAVRTDYARASLMLQEAYGLRRKECLKVIPSKSPADNSRLVLHGNATKGGRPRTIPADTPERRAALAYAREVAGGGSLIPPRYSYEDWREVYRTEAERAGVPNGSTHLLRRGHAQERLETLRGDHDGNEGNARDELAQELGHGRRHVVGYYVGKAGGGQADGE